ncbi:MAG: response regulator [Deltaproteobacteria bacterium]|nr:response regulator [Deltaproteobacteria bacterium]
MDTLSSGFQHSAVDGHDLLIDDEVIVLVDDDAFIRNIKMFFEDRGLAVVEADSGQALWNIIDRHNVALVLLDIGLPDIDGKTIPSQLKANHPDIAILMLTGISDLQTAMECIRAGADDYLAKPAQLNEVLLAVRKILEKRRLLILNRQYQEDLENANFRIQLMHQLSLKMNTVYLNTVQLDEILQAILVGITAGEGLRFNRAFLAMIDDDDVLRGRLAIGPGCREEAGHIWQALSRKKMDFFAIVRDLQTCNPDEETPVNKLVKKLEIPLTEVGHVLIRCALERKSIRVVNGAANGFDLSGVINLFGADEFIIVPLYSPRRPLGVIIADNLITGRAISNSYVSAMELFASQASLVIEHSRLYMDMQGTISELKKVNNELDKNKNLLVQAERYSALGHMAAQMVHNVRNPITAIGGVARIMAKKNPPEGFNKYINVMVRETDRLENILSTLFEFVDSDEMVKEKTAIYPLVQNVLFLLQKEIGQQGITVNINFADSQQELLIDGDQISKIIVHLCRNAVEAMPAGGVLTIDGSVVGDWFNLVIIDSGQSVDTGLEPRIMEPFYTTKVYGTGMGLTIVERIVAAHGGNFTIQRIDNGTEVVVRLPM